MIGVLVQLLFFLCIAIAQVSFFSIAFASPFANILVATTLVLTLTRGFLPSWKWVVVLGCMYDILTNHTLGMTALTLLCISYGMSFISRRFLMEHQMIGMVTAVITLFFSSAVFVPMLWLFQYILLDKPFLLASLVAYGQTLPLVSGAILSVGLFLITYIVISRLNNSLEFYGDKVIVKR